MPVSDMILAAVAILCILLATYLRKTTDSEGTIMFLLIIAGGCLISVSVVP